MSLFYASRYISAFRDRYLWIKILIALLRLRVYARGLAKSRTSFSNALYIALLRCLLFKYISNT